MRVIFTCYSVATLLYSIIFYNQAIWPIFLTNWNLVIGTVYFICITAISGLHGLDLPEDQEKRPQIIEMNNDIENPKNILNKKLQRLDSAVEKVAFSLFWIWYGLTYVICTVMVVLYWAFVVEDFHFDTPELVFSYVNDHGINLVLILIDFCFQKIPVRLFHVVYSIIVAIIYIILSIIYNFTADKPIYKVVDWNDKPGWAAFYVVLALVLVVIMQCIFYGLYRLKLCLKNK